MTTDDTPIETSEAEARPWKPSDGYLPAGGDDEHPAVKALDLAFAEIRWRNEGVRDLLRGAFMRHIAEAPQPPAAQQGDLCQNCAPDGRCMKRQALCGVKLAAQQGEAVAPTRADLIAALNFYATGEHFILSEPSAWDTVSGEPQNWQCDKTGTATVEDGWIAKATLEGRITAEQIEALEDGETLDDATQPAAAPQPVAQGDDLLEIARRTGLRQHLHGVNATDARALLSAFMAAAAPAGVVGEAVASIYISPNGEREMDDWRHALPVGRNILYTAPPARQALSQKAVVEAFCKLPHQVQYVCTFEAGVRFAERAHDIGG